MKEGQDEEIITEIRRNYYYKERKSIRNEKNRTRKRSSKLKKI